MESPLEGSMYQPWVPGSCGERAEVQGTAQAGACKFHMTLDDSCSSPHLAFLSANRGHGRTCLVDLLRELPEITYRKCGKH